WSVTLFVMMLEQSQAIVKSTHTDQEQHSQMRLQWAACLAALMVFSRGGHITLFNGYFTLELVLATFAAIHWGGRRPWCAAVALMIVSAKPTYILPLGFLMLARGNYRAILYGAVLSVLAAALPLGYVAYHESLRATGEVDLQAGLQKVIDDIGIAQEVHMAQEDESPVHSWTRLDLLASICKWTGQEPGQLAHLAVMFLMLAAPLWLLVQRRRNDVEDGLIGGTGSLILIAGLSSLYHQSYDALLLVAPLAGLAAGQGFWARQSTVLRVVLAGLCLIPMYSYFSTRMILLRFDSFGEIGFRLATSLNGFVIAVALALLCIQLWKSPNKY
ncbi:MAG: hypothetical protein AAFV88_25135, partial [Planctomycetota bacterium]